MAEANPKAIAAAIWSFNEDIMAVARRIPMSATRGAMRELIKKAAE